MDLSWHDCKRRFENSIAYSHKRRRSNQGPRPGSASRATPCRLTWETAEICRKLMPKNAFSRLMAPRLIETDAQMSSNGNVMTMYSRDSCTQTKQSNSASNWCMDQWTQSGRCMWMKFLKCLVRVRTLEVWAHVAPFFPFSKTGCGWLWDCHSPNWQRDQLNNY